MKKVLLIVAGICFGVHSWAQKDIDFINAAGSGAGNEKVTKAHFKVSYHPYHSAHTITFIKPISRRNYRITIPKDNNNIRGLAGAKVLMHKRNNLPPISLLGYPSLAYGEPKPFDCSCRASGIQLYQCSTGKINKVSLQPAVNAGSLKLSELADANDGGLNIGLTQKTSLTVDLGYSKGATDTTQDLTMNMDSDGDDGLDISIGLQFGIR